MKEYRHASTVIEITARQQVISTGLYARVRHPLYSGALLVSFVTPIALGSWWGLTTMLGWLIAIVVRLRDEEELLQRDLPGYEAYCQRVRYRLIPRIQ